MQNYEKLYDLNEYLQGRRINIRSELREIFGFERSDKYQKGTSQFMKESHRKVSILVMPAIRTNT